MEPDYTKREIDLIIADMAESITRIERVHGKELSEIKELQIYTNGKVKNHTRILLIVGSVLTTLLVTNSSELLQVFKLII